MNTNTTATPPPGRALRLHRELTAIWGSGTGWQRLSSVNHSVIGMRLMVTAFVFFLIAGVLGMLTRVQLATPGSAFMDPDTYGQIFTLHGSMMLFLFAIPMLEGMAVYLTPKFLGARDFAFPRLTAFSYWCYLFGASIVTGSLLFGVAPNSGWFMYTPLSSDVYSPGINADVWLLGVTFVEVSALSFAVEISVSVLKMRAPGMALNRMPIFGWYILITALMMLVAFPPLILASILLELERAFGLAIFDPTRGGDALLWQHLFWLFGHPDVYIIFLPMAGVLSTLIPVLCGRPLLGYRAIVVSIIALAFISFGIWVHHMFSVGIPHLALGFFSAATAIVAVPTAVQVFAWLGTLGMGRPRWNVPMLYIFGFFVIFVLGGLTGVMLAIVPFNWQAHDTYFVVAHLHYVVAGAFAFPLLAALYYWLPLMTGREPTLKLSVPAFWLIFIGFNGTFLLMHLTGLLGMPRRVFTYAASDGWTTLNLLSSIGSFVMTIGFGLLLIDLLVQLRYGRRVRRDPWNASTLEWAMPMPPAPYNFASIPDVSDGDDRVEPAKLAPALARGEGYLAGTRNGWQETIGVHVTSGVPDQLIVLPKSTFLPLWTALVLATAVLGFLAKAYWLTAGAALVVAGMFIYGAQGAGLAEDHGPLPIGHGVDVPPHTEASGSPPWWAMVFSLVADGTLFTALIFGTFYLWIAAPGWPPALSPETHLLPAVGTVVALIIAAFAARGSQHSLGAGGRPQGWIGLAAIALVVSIALLVMMIGDIVPQPTEHALGATSAVLLGYVTVHAGIGLLFLLSNVLRISAGRISVRRQMDLRLTRMWLSYTFATGAIAVGLVLVLPTLVSMLPATP